MLEERVENWKERYIQQGVKQGRGLGRKEGRKEGRQEGLEQGRQEGRKEGLEKGLEQGRQEGQRHGRVQSICDVLEVRFGTVPPRLTHTLSSMTDEALRKLTKSALTVSSLQEFVALLEGQKG